MKGIRFDHFSASAEDWCEDCHDTGLTGDNGPGGGLKNWEYGPCSCNPMIRAARVLARANAAELALLQNQLQNVEAERDQIVALMREEHNALTAENRVILQLVEDSHGLFRDACSVAVDCFRQGLSVEIGIGTARMRDVAEEKIEELNRTIKNISTAREVERVKALEKFHETVRIGYPFVTDKWAREHLANDHMVTLDHKDECALAQYLVEIWDGLVALGAVRKPK